MSKTDLQNERGLSSSPVSPQRGASYPESLKSENFDPDAILRGSSLRAVTSEDLSRAASNESKRSANHFSSQGDDIFSRPPSPFRNASACDVESEELSGILHQSKSKDSAQAQIPSSGTIAPSASKTLAPPAALTKK